jgi:hypothetical protein
VAVIEAIRAAAASGRMEPVACEGI